VAILAVFGGPVPQAVDLLAQSTPLHCVRLDEFVSRRQLFSQDLLLCSHSEQFFFDRCPYFTRCAPVWQVPYGSGLLRNVLDAFSISGRWGLSCQQLPPRYISFGHIISIVITVINFTVSSNASLSSVDQWLLSSPMLDKKHEEQRAHALAGGAKPPSLASGLAWPITMG